jgi:hypothetical protein
MFVRRKRDFRNVLLTDSFLWNVYHIHSVSLFSNENHWTSFCFLTKKQNFLFKFELISINTTYNRWIWTSQSTIINKIIHYFFGSIIDHSCFIHSQTLTYPCTQISINYNKFLHIHYTLHQICNSVFITQNWFYYLAYDSWGIVFNNDIRWIGPYAFQALNGFCQSINKTIVDSLEQFYSNQYISASVTPSHLFQSQVQSLVDQFRSSITNNYLLSLSLIRDTTQNNGLFSGEWTNYELYVSDDTEVFSNARSYGNWSCASSATCIGPIGIYNYPSSQTLLDVPRFLYRMLYNRMITSI